MGRMVFRPVSDIDVSNIGDWEKSNSKMSCAAALVNLDDEYIYMKGRAESTGNIKLQLGLDESTRPDCFSFHITNIGVEGIYSAGKNLTTGTIDTTLDLLSNSFTNSTGTSKLEYQISLDSNQTNARIAANYSRDVGSKNTYIDELRDFGPMTLQISGVHSASSSAKSGAFSLDQLFIYVDYEPVFLSVKQGGTWVECSNVYQKVNGIWVEQDVDFLGRTNKSPAFQTFTHQVGPILSPVFSENSWEDIATACELNIVPTSWKVGDEKIMEFSDENQTIVILDKFHDYYSSNNKAAPLTFGMKNCLQTEGYFIRFWSSEEARIALLPKSLQPRLKGVYKTQRYNRGYYPDRKVFCFSDAEVTGDNPSHQYGGYAHDDIYEYYKNTQNRIKQINNDPAEYWLRDYDDGDDPYALYYSSVNNQSYATYNFDNKKKGISFGFCF